MGKFKVSFTTALFVFAFLMCVIVAVVFVDRTPKNDYDAFYDEERPSERARNRDGEAEQADGDWKRGSATAPAPAPTAAPDPAAGLADLPIDQNLANSAIPVPGTPAAAGTPNPVQGMSPEQAARFWMNKASGKAPLPSPTIPGMALPPGMETPAMGTPAAPTPYGAPSSSLPILTNAPGSGAPGMPAGLANGGRRSSLLTPPSLNTSNASEGWNPVTESPTPGNMLGVRSAPSGDNGMMISTGKTRSGATPPPGFEDNGIINDGTATPFSGSGATGSSSSSLPPPPSLSTGPAPSTGAAPSPGTTANPGGQLLYAPPAGGASNPYQLPPAPTLRPPPIQDPDKRRSDAGQDATENPTPGSQDPNGSGGQAVAVSGDNPAPAAPASTPEKDVKVVARVNDVELTSDDATRLAEARALMEKKPLTEETRKDQIKDAVKRWTDIAAAAELAREKNLSVSKDDLDRYAAMHPDVDLEKLRKSLAEVGYTPEQVDQHVEDLALAEKLVASRADEKYPEKELRKIYEKDPKSYSTPRRVHVQEIFKKKPEDEAKAKKVAAEMRRLQRQASGTDFSLLARQVSEADTKSKGGDLGWLDPEDKGNAQVGKAIKELKQGDVSSVVETEEGYYIYRVSEDEPAKDDFDSGKELVLEKLKKDLRNDVIAEARKAETVELDPKGRVVKARKEDKAIAAKAEDSKKEQEKPKVAKPEEKESAPRNEGGDSKAVAATSPAPAPENSPAAPAQPTPPPTQSLAPAQAQTQFAASSQPAQQQMPGQPSPVSVQGMASSSPTPVQGYRPGQVITVGSNSTASMNPAPAVSVSNPAPTAIQSNVSVAGRSPAAQAVIAQEAAAMQAKAQAEAQARNQAVEWQLRQAAAARQQGGSAPVQGGSPGNMSVPGGNIGAAADAAQPAQPGSTPAATDRQAINSNGWEVTKTVEQPKTETTPATGHSPGPVDGGSQLPPGFGGNAAGAAAAPAGAPAQPDQQQAQEEEPKRSGGIVGGVKNFFGGFRR